MVTIVLLVSRSEYLNLVFASLEMMMCDFEKTNLLCIVDGDINLFATARNKVEASKFNDRLCVQFKSTDKMKRYDMQHRRKRIAKLHNFAKQFIQKSSYIFIIEDDTTFDPTTLDKLLADYDMLPYAGFIQGVQMGRHGIKHFGVWQADDVYEPNEIKSTKRMGGVAECDAGGLYCMLTKAENYMAHEFKPFNHGDLGPDVDYGLALRQQGYLNYTDWSINTLHHTKTGVINPKTEPHIVSFIKVERRYRQKTEI